jgi:hypothetical protein
MVPEGRAVCRRDGMSERKYRQRGYQDESRPERQAPRPKPDAARDPRLPRDPKVPNVPGFRQVFRCARCGSVEASAVGSLSTCSKCGVDLHACIHCESFDPSAVFACREKIPVRISPKDVRNDCSLFTARQQVERETGSTAPASARKALDDLFKF